MHPAIFGSDEFQSDFKIILDLMETETWRGSHAKLYMEGLAATINSSSFNELAVTKLLTFLDENDRRRKLNWRELFPWLIKYEALCGITK